MLGESVLQKENTIEITVGKEVIALETDRILYVIMKRNDALIHVEKDQVYSTRITMTELMNRLGDEFILVHRSVLVSARAIHKIDDKIYLSNGEELEYVVRKKSALQKQLTQIQKKIICSFDTADVPMKREDYFEYYRSFDHMPIAFTDIEMIFDEENNAVDWIFRYGNQALAELEKVPLDKLIDHSFGSIFPNMDSKWLRSYERATLFGEKREIIDYSPEIETYLKIICFPTFKGHCGCILFDVSEIEFTRTGDDVEAALLLYFGKPLQR